MPMGKVARSAITATVAVLLAGAVLAQDGPVRKKIAIKAGTVITISGDDISGGVVLIEDGRIADVGKDLEIPWDADVIDVPEGVVMPGYVEAHTYQGIRTANEKVLEVPFISTIDGIDPISWFIDDSRRDGVTTILVLPGNDTVVGGTGVAVKPTGRTVDDMIVRDFTGMKLSLQARADSSRMAHIARMRRYFTDLVEYVDQYNQRKADAEEAKKDFDEEIDPKKQAAIDLLDGKLTAFVYCPRASDVAKAIEITEEFGINMIPVLGADCYKAAALLAEKELPAILDSRLIVWETDEDTETEEMKIIPKIMADAGVKFALQRDGNAIDRRYFWLQAARCVANGVSRQEALKSITLYPAEMIGVAERVGTIEKGKDANLLVLTGDPLDSQSWVDQVLIEGEVVYTRADDQYLEKLLAEGRTSAGVAGINDDVDPEPDEEKTETPDGESEQ
ncbi:MAG TPA: amidohydrolase family protein [Armatimonadota bacterium]|nr:amidohydrolase family protein [Armatimonadota bacterium]